MIWRIQKSNGVNQRGGKSKQSFCCFCQRQESRGHHARPQKGAMSSWTWTPMRSNSRCEEQHKSQKCDSFLKGVLPNPFSSPMLPRNRTLAPDTTWQWESRLWAGLSEPPVELLSEDFHTSLQGRALFLPPLLIGWELLVWGWDTNYTSSELKCFLPVQTPQFNWIRHRVSQKHFHLAEL